jgi:hypothetical protein
VLLNGQAYSGSAPTRDLREALIVTILDFLQERVSTYTPTLQFKEEVGDRIGILGGGEFSIVEMADAILRTIQGVHDE